MDTTTPFTKIVNKEIPTKIIYEDNNHLAFLSIEPFEKGHTIVIPKKAYENIFEIPESELKELIVIVQKIAKHYRKILDCGINVCQNNLFIAAQSVNHIHFHVIPRLDKKKFYTDDNLKYLTHEMELWKNKLKI
jgi:histidine triad (HIT) family protein